MLFKNENKKLILATLWGLRVWGNVRTPSRPIARWEARGRLPIRHN